MRFGVLIATLVIAGAACTPATTRGSRTGQRQAEKGTPIISADLDELIGLSDTVLVMLRGRIVATLDPAEITPRDLGAYMTGVAVQEEAS